MGMPAPPPNEPVDESWLATYADAITLLMAFFVMLLTFAEYDIPAFEEASTAIKNNVGSTNEVSPTQELKIETQDIVFEMQADQVVSVAQDNRGIVIELASRAFFKPGSATFRDAAIPVLEKMTSLLGAPKFACFNIEVKGHTDDEPIRTKQFPSNWELSAARASRVVRFFIEQKLEAFRFKAIGLAATRPKVPNRDPEGKPIKENQATNRRINLHVERMSLEEQKLCNEKTDFKDILKKVQKKGAQPTDGPATQAPPAQAPKSN